MRRWAAVGGFAALLSTLVMAAPAAADIFGPISLVSRIAPPFVSEQDSEQFSFAHDPAISGNGRYVAFDGLFRGVEGVWRRDLQTGEVQQVAGGAAELPSISWEGRYVSFTTDEGGQLVADTDEQPLEHASAEAPNVYRRDMSRAPSEGAFAIVSAVSGSEEALTYQTADPTYYGSEAAGRSAMSANGQKVVFVTTAVSNLDGPNTPALQVAVRDLEADTTELVSAEAPHEAGAAPKPVPGESRIGLFYGAVYTEGGPPRFEPPPALHEPFQNAIGASISADGSTVAWMGQNIAQQAQMLPDESPPAKYAEPLWRRISDLPESPTRRITGGSDPANPACVASGETALPLDLAQSASDPCQGPFRVSSQELGLWAGAPGDAVPRLSENGELVAFLSDACLVSLGDDYGNSCESNPSDLYVANMREGLTRSEALRPLTALSTGNFRNIATAGPIIELAISPDGSQVAFTTQRTEFPLGSLTYVDAPTPEAGLAELYDVDLSDNTLTRLTQGFEGAPSEHPHRPAAAGTDPYRSEDGALSPSFSGDGNTLAFSSTASNLVYGDGNTPPIGPEEEVSDGSDVFLVSRVPFSSTPTPQSISSPPAGPSLSPVWTLGVTALSRRNGSVLLEVMTPGAGTLHASADSAVLVSVRGVRAKRSAHGAARTHTSAVLATRAVASAAKSAGAEGGLLALPLALASKYSSLASRRGGLSANVNVTFSAPGHPVLHRTLTVTFLQPAVASRVKPRAKNARRPR